VWQSVDRHCEVFLQVNKLNRIAIKTPSIPLRPVPTQTWVVVSRQYGPADAPPSFLERPARLLRARPLEKPPQFPEDFSRLLHPRLHWPTLWRGCQTLDKPSEIRQTFYATDTDDEKVIEK